MKKVLVVSYFFPPLNNMGAKRFGTMCKYFNKYGYETSIVMSAPHANCFLNAKLDLKVPEDIHEIIRIGRTGASYVPKTVFSQMIVQWLNKKNRQTRTLSGTALGWYEKVKQELVLSRLSDIDIIVGTYPSMENLLVASYLSKKLKCPFVADIRDLITEYSEKPGTKKRSYVLDMFVENAILKKASGIVTVTQGFEKILKNKYPKSETKVIFNGWEENIRVQKNKTEENYLYYAGTLYPHRLESFQLLMNCLKEITKIKDMKIKIRSLGPEDLDVKMKKMVKENDMEQYIEVLEAADESVIKKEQANAYINIVLSSINEKDRALMTTIPGKLYEVMKEEAPVLAIIPEISDVAHVVAKTEKGIATVSKQKIIDFILNVDNSCRGNQYINFYSRKNQAKRYCNFLDSLLI